MAVIEFGRRRLFFLIAALGTLYFLYELTLLTGNEGRDRVSYVPIPDGPADVAPPYFEVPPSSPKSYAPPEPASTHIPDAHPITTLMKEADARWRVYESSRSRSFRQVVEKYRSKYGRHPPPGFKDWYKFARQKNVWNIDDFDQIMDDLRPFWAIEPKIIRTYAAHMWEDSELGIASLHVRNNAIAAVHNPGWRSETMEEIISHFIQYLPDMDIPMNKLDQPRIVVPWEEMQNYLAKEYATRAMPPETIDGFTTKQEALLDVSIQEGEVDESPRYDPEWFDRPGSQYMEIASKACPPNSPARSPAMSIQSADLLYKEPIGGLVSNFNLSSDLCTVGPALQDLHGFLYSASSITASYKLVPIFGECKVNVNNDILFPANMYYRHDSRYDYSDEEDIPWKEKSDTIIWRGVTSGGVQVADNWSRMHRQRLVQLLNATYMSQEGRTVPILAHDMDLVEPNQVNTSFVKYPNFVPGTFAEKHTDVGFVEAWGCVPDCSFYDNVFSLKNGTTLTRQFRSKYLMDVDGHSFSGRWHAFLQSKSLGFKATIFREWHDSRLFAWRHFVPVDNRYDDLYSLLTYFIGYGNPDDVYPDNANGGVYVPSHEMEAQKIAQQGREWANKVLRRDDIEVYMFRLLLEYGRIIDDNRDRIGYSGDGSELDKFDDEKDETWKSQWGFDKVEQLWKGWGKKADDIDEYMND
jgi:Glycosyl transferase family 90